MPPTVRPAPCDPPDLEPPLSLEERRGFGLRGCGGQLVYDAKGVIIGAIREALRGAEIRHALADAREANAQRREKRLTDAELAARAAARRRDPWALT
jgi:hypothetical protein